MIVDVQATFLGTESKSDLIKEMGKLTLRRDPNLPKKLTEEQKRIAHQHPDLIKAQSTFQRAKVNLKSECLHANEAPSDHPAKIAYEGAKKEATKLKSRTEKQAFEKLLKDFHPTADLQHMVAQLQGEEPLSAPMLAAVPHALPERNKLAKDLFVSADDGAFADIVNTMSRLCALSEDRKCPLRPIDAVDTCSLDDEPRPMPAKSALKPDVSEQKPKAVPSVLGNPRSIQKPVPKVVTEGVPRGAVVGVSAKVAPRRPISKVHKIDLNTLEDVIAVDWL